MNRLIVYLKNQLTIKLNNASLILRHFIKKSINYFSYQIKKHNIRELYSKTNNLKNTIIHFIQIEHKYNSLVKSRTEPNGQCQFCNNTINMSEKCSNCNEFQIDTTELNFMLNNLEETPKFGLFTKSIFLFLITIILFDLIGDNIFGFWGISFVGSISIIAYFYFWGTKFNLLNTNSVPRIKYKFDKIQLKQKREDYLFMTRTSIIVPIFALMAINNPDLNMFKKHFTNTTPTPTIKHTNLMVFSIFEYTIKEKCKKYTYIGLFNGIHYVNTSLIDCSGYRLGVSYTQLERYRINGIEMMPIVIDSIYDDFPLAGSKMKVGDTIVRINNSSLNEKINLFEFLQSNKEKPIKLVRVKKGIIDSIIVRSEWRK